MNGFRASTDKQSYYKKWYINNQITLINESPETTQTCPGYQAIEEKVLPTMWIRLDRQSVSSTQGTANPTCSSPIAKRGGSNPKLHDIS